MGLERFAVDTALRAHGKSNGSVSARLWNAIRSDDWAIPHVGLSSLGEIVVWTRPDEFPPRHMQTSKGLRALGYNVRIGV
ncbi:MAG: hypothetical protein E6525_28395 [Klebsiella grimontii]|nr:hypothetical protein [Klebsiella grimontii]